MANDDDRRAALIDAIISAYHTTRLRETPAATHILGKDRVRRLFDEMDIASERRAYEKAAAIADKWAEQDCTPEAVAMAEDISEDIRALASSDEGEW